jgi:hypothetical protein
VKPKSKEQQTELKTEFCILRVRSNGRVKGFPKATEYNLADFSKMNF